MIQVQHLTKRYGTHTAVSDLSFSIEPGIIYGFLGPNGAGKSTTMNILTGCLSATSGEVSIDGCDIFDNPTEAKRKIGYLPEFPPLYLDMTPTEYLRFVAEAKGVKKANLAAQIDRVSGLTGLRDVQNRLIRNLSKGYRQRVGIAQALLGNPEVIILDEPTVGLDPLQIIEIRDLIRKLGKDHTVILSSHILPEVQAVCDSILILSHGKLVAADKTENLERLLAGKVTVELSVRAAAAQARRVLSAVKGVEELEQRPEKEPGVAEFVVTAAENADLREPLFRAFAAQKLPLLRLSAVRVSLEDVFLELTRDEPPEAAQAALVKAPAETSEDASAKPAQEAPAEPAQEAPAHSEEGGDAQ